MRYEFAAPARVVVGPGTSSEIPALVEGIGRTGFLVHGRAAASRPGPIADLIRALENRGLVAAFLAGGGEPEIGVVEAGAARARDARCDVVIAIGGGSVIDTAKAIAGLAANPGRALDYMEVVGLGQPLRLPALPIVAVPTTAGTGSEVTRNAVVLSPEHRVKVSIRSPWLIPRVAVVDSILTHNLPSQVTASSGLDALTQLLEAYVSLRAQPITDGICAEGLSRVAWALQRAYHQPDDAEAREAMSTASLMSGLALANAGLGAIHGIAATLGGAHDVPHGAACADLLTHVTRLNIRSLRRRSPASSALDRYGKAADLLRSPGTAGDSLIDLPARLQDLVQELNIPRLATYGLTSASARPLAEQAAKASSTRGNPIELEVSELEEAILAAL